MICYTNQFMVYGLWFMVSAVSLTTNNYKLQTTAPKGVG